MTTLVTGATGHVGANLVRTLLARGREVRALVHVDRRPLAGLNIEIVAGDVRDPASLDKAFAGVDTVYHLAATISLTAGPALEAVNVTGTRNVVEAGLRHRVTRMVHFSSIHAVAPDPTRPLIDESCALVDAAHCLTYNQSKSGGEAEIRRGLDRGLDVVIIRPTAILGPFDFQPSFFGEVVLSLARGRLPALVAGGFDWVDVRDVVQGAIRAQETATPGSEYLLSGHWATLREVAVMVDSIAGGGVPGFTCPLWLAGLSAPFAAAAARLRKRRPLFTPFSIDTLQTSSQVSHHRAARELGYLPRPLRDSVRDTLQWFHKAGLLTCPNGHTFEDPR
jgi:dihydroflavonol-4-reductase